MVYPEKLLGQKVQQIVSAKVTVSEKAQLIKIDFTESTNQDFKEEFIRLLRLIEWLPAKKNGVEFTTTADIKIDFNLERYKRAVKKRGFSKPKTDKKIPYDTSNVVLVYPSQMAEYYKGENELNDFIFENLEYPDLAKKQHIQGVVQLSFIIETNGMISNIKIEKSVGAGCNEAAIDVIRQTRWKPAIDKGKYVRSRYSYAINFSLNDNFKSNELSEQK
jgi:TonB family protein